ncbi:MAG TPA: DUF2088 domain-containing protein [Candidatus Kapabacteria bacterium]|nr:DUF2088 domain-containing protein [Candidatus Kapabacteria bacterium]
MKLHRVRQEFPRPCIAPEKIEATTRQQLEHCGAHITRGASIAIACGSRGIANVDRIAKTVVEWVRAAGGKPFIIPAMGSHGGATAKGQAAVLEAYGINEQTMGCPIRSSMDVMELRPDALFMDRHAWESDGVILINRIKPHTDFHGQFESGLVKMSVIGLGKEKQAIAMHAWGIIGLRDMIPQIARRVVEMGKILLGVGIVENAYDETAMIEAIAAKDFFAREPELLAIAKQNMPRLPVEDIDVLIVDQLGKNISGTGIDTNIIGRIRIDGQPEPSSPRIKSIVVSDLTPETHGNACGIGLADIVTRRLADKIDFKTTYTNIITSGFLERGKLPVVADTDRHAFEIALRAAGCREPENARVIRIRDTLHLSNILVSASVLSVMRNRGLDGGEPRYDPVPE